MASAPRRRPSWSPNRSHYRSRSPAPSPSNPAPCPSLPPSPRSSSASPRSSPACSRDRSSFPPALPLPAKRSDQVAAKHHAEQTTTRGLSPRGWPQTMEDKGKANAARRDPSRRARVCMCPLTSGSSLPWQHADGRAWASRTLTPRGRRPRRPALPRRARQLTIRHPLPLPPVSISTPPLLRAVSDHHDSLLGEATAGSKQGAHARHAGSASNAPALQGLSGYSSYSSAAPSRARGTHRDSHWKIGVFAVGWDGRRKN